MTQSVLSTVPTEDRGNHKIIIVPTLLRGNAQPDALRQQTQAQEKAMGRSRYLITEADKPHFLTCTVLDWLPVFTRPETVSIILDCWQYQRQHKALKLYGYVILENHLHFIAQAPQLNKTVAEFKSFTARRILDYLKQQRQQHLLKRFAYLKKRHKVDREYQFWQEGVHAELILHDNMMRGKLDYIHHNPVKRGYVKLAEHWRYSSATNYFLGEGLIEIDRY